MRIILRYINNNFAPYLSSVLVKVLMQIENMADRKIKKNIDENTFRKVYTKPRNAASSNNENVNVESSQKISQGAAASVVEPFKELSLDRNARIPTGEVLSNENLSSNAFNSTVRETNSSISTDPNSNGIEAAVELGYTFIDNTTNSETSPSERRMLEQFNRKYITRPNSAASAAGLAGGTSYGADPAVELGFVVINKTTHSLITNNPFARGMHLISEIRNLNRARTASADSADGMACGTSADMRANVQGRYGPGTVADSKSYDPNSRVSSIPGSSFLPGAFRIPPEKPRQDENVEAMNYLKFHNIRLDNLPNKENIKENIFDIEFNSNCGDNYAFNFNRLDASLIRDVVSGALGGGKVEDFTGSEQTLLLDICKQNEIQMYDLFGRLIFGIVPESEDPKPSFFLNSIMKKYRKLVAVNFAYMRPMIRINERFLRLYAEDIRDKLIKDVRKENLYLASRSYPPHVDKTMFVSTGILRRAVEFLCTLYRELMTNITTNNLTSTHVEYCKRDKN